MIMFCQLLTLLVIYKDIPNFMAGVGFKGREGGGIREGNK